MAKDIYQENELKLVTAFIMKNGRKVTIMENNEGEFWVGVDIPEIKPTDGQMIRYSKFTAMPPIMPMGGFTDYNAAVLAAKAYYLHDPVAQDKFEEHSRDVMRRAISTMWQRYNTDNRFAIEVANTLNIPQHKKVAKEAVNG